VRQEAMLSMNKAQSYLTMCHCLRQAAGADGCTRVLTGV
jgi:hypothetical protein